MALPILTLTQACMGYGRKVVCGPIDLEIMRSDHLLITGPNGGGKSTLLKTIIGLIPLRGGFMQRYDAAGNPTERLKMGYLPQINTQDRAFPISVHQVIDSGITKGSKAERHKRVNELLKLIDLEPFARYAVGKLSGGQLQRVLLARAMAAEPEMLILDEPMSYLDTASRHRFHDLLYRITPPETTILMVTHDYPDEHSPLIWRSLIIGE